VIVDFTNTAMKKRHYLPLMLTLVAFLMIEPLFGQATYTSTGAGADNWNATTTWTLTAGADGDGNGLPDADDNVIIANGTPVNVNVGSACANLTINGSGILNFPSNQTLTVNGNVIMDGTSQITGTSNNRIMNVTGTFTVPLTATNARISGIRLTVTGATTVLGTFVLNSDTGVKTFTGRVTVSGSWTSTSITTNNNLVFGGEVLTSGTFACGCN
jgi:hypothetical protein